MIVRSSTRRLSEPSRVSRISSSNRQKNQLESKSGSLFEDTPGHASQRDARKLAGGANPPVYRVNNPQTPQGRGKQSVHYAINTPESALSRRFWNEKSRADDPTDLARQIARVLCRYYPHGGWNSVEH